MRRPSKAPTWRGPYSYLRDEPREQIQLPLGRNRLLSQFAFAVSKCARWGAVKVGNILQRKSTAKRRILSIARLTKLSFVTRSCILLLCPYVDKTSGVVTVRIFLCTEHGVESHAGRVAVVVIARWVSPSGPQIYPTRRISAKAERLGTGSPVGALSCCATVLHSKHMMLGSKTDQPWRFLPIVAAGTSGFSLPKTRAGRLASLEIDTSQRRLAMRLPSAQRQIETRVISNPTVINLVRLGFSWGDPHTGSASRPLLSIMRRWH